MAANVISKNIRPGVIPAVEDTRQEQGAKWTVSPPLPEGVTRPETPRKGGGGPVDLRWESISGRVTAARA